MARKREKLGERIRSMRHARALSQEGLAELSGLHRTYIGGIERGERNVSLENIYRIASALKIGIGDFFCDEASAREQ